MTRQLQHLMLMTLALLAAASAAQADKPSFRAAKAVIPLGELSTGRPATISLWYPEGHCEGLASQQHCLAEGAVTDRTIVLSHGAMGAADNYQWLGDAFASAGYILVGINHYGESWFYGPTTQSMQATAMVWQRPEDISAVYDALSNRHLFQLPVNWSNIIAVGHSSGAQTLAMLAGVQFDLLQMLAFCNSGAASQDHSCDYGLRQTPPPPDTFVARFGASYRDSRVKKILLIDPTLGYGATAASLAAVTLPTLIVGAQHNDFLPWENHGARYAAIPQAQVHLLTGDEGHFVFLDRCDSEQQVMGVPLCHDRPSVNRTKVHDGLLPVMRAFIQADDLLIEPPKQVTEHRKPFWQPNASLLSVLYYTPRWVFGLLAGLILLGLLQTRTRQLPIAAALMMPVGMTCMSLTGTLMELGIRPSTLGYWLMGAAIVTAAKLRLTSPRAFYCHRPTRKIEIHGSWIPLLVILAIFSTRYAVGMSKGMQLSVVHSPYFSPSFACVLGAFSGYFMADTYRYWQLFTDRHQTMP